MKMILYYLLFVYLVKKISELYNRLKTKTLEYNVNERNNTIIINKIFNFMKLFDIAYFKFTNYFENYEKLKNVLSYFRLFYLTSVNFVLWVEKIVIKNLEFIYETSPIIKQCESEIKFLFLNKGEQDNKYDIKNIDSILTDVKKEIETVNYESLVRELVSNIPNKTINIKRDD